MLYGVVIYFVFQEVRPEAVHRKRIRGIIYIGFDRVDCIYNFDFVEVFSILIDGVITHIWIACITCRLKECVLWLLCCRKGKIGILWVIVIRDNRSNQVFLSM